jgi:hypothetical protein
MWKGLWCRGKHKSEEEFTALPHQGKSAKERKWKEGHTGV